jgi:type VI secretion system protein ImpF
MPQPNPTQGLMPSLLDRLIDPESGGNNWRRGYGVEQMFAAVQRDMEEMLNTRTSYVGLPDAYREVRNSIFTYGLPDLTSLEAITPQQREEIGNALAGAIARFEPRLRDIQVHMLDLADSKARTIRFHIQARLCLEPAPECAFDTILELSTGRYSVTPSNT